jgi:hypothetical protein
MTTHELKTWPIYFAALASGRKTFELRRNDRNFVEGDQLRLREWNPDTESYTGAEIECSVSYVLTGNGLCDGFAALGLSAPITTRPDQD